MPLTCSCEDGDTYDYCFITAGYHPYQRKRSRKCISCGDRISTGDTVLVFKKWRRAKDEIEEYIYQNNENCTVPLADEYVCEVCGDLYHSLEELGYCLDLGENYKELVKEYAEERKMK